VLFTTVSPHCTYTHSNLMQHKQDAICVAYASCTSYALQASLSNNHRRHSNSSTSSNTGVQRSKSSGATATAKTLSSSRARSGSSSNSGNTVAGAYATATSSHSSSHGRLRVPRNRAVATSVNTGASTSLQPAWDSGGMHIMNTNTSILFIRLHSAQVLVVACGILNAFHIQHTCKQQFLQYTVLLCLRPDV
jgi:hypothetical protein